MSETKSWVYFIQGGPERLIKIGVTETPMTRLANMQGGCPVELVLVACVSGDLSAEQKLHNKFKKSRAHHEWFWPTSDLVDFIRGIDSGDLVQDATTTMEEFEGKRWEAMCHAIEALQ